MAKIRQIDAAQVRVEPGVHPLDEKYNHEIESFWRIQKKIKPALFDGEAFMTVRIRFDQNKIQAVYRRTRFATSLFWRSHPTDIDGVYNIFSMAAAISCENDVLMGKMASHTANAGKMYMPSGSISDEDIRNNVVDYERCLLREFAEETGFNLNSEKAAPGFIMIETKAVICLVKEFWLELSTKELVSTVRANLPKLAEQELEEVLALAPGIIHNDMPQYLQAYQQRRKCETSTGL